MTALSIAPVLEAHAVTQKFGGLTAVDSMEISVPEGHVCGLIGANGAGKTTFLRALAGEIRPTAGTVRLFDDDATRHGAAWRARRGLARTFQHPQLVSSLTCLENVALGAQMRDLTALGGPRPTLRRASAERSYLRESAQALTQVDLPERMWDLRPGEVPPPAHRWVEIARCIAADAKVLLLDEPNSGFTRPETEHLVELVLAARERGTAVVLVTHDVTLAMRVCDSMVAMDRGRLIGTGPPSDVIERPEVIAAYLGSLGHKLATQTGPRHA